LFVEKLNQLSDRIRAKPEFLRKRIINHGDAFCRSWEQFSVAEITSRENWQSEDSRVVTSNHGEHRVHRSRLRISAADRGDQPAVIRSAERKTRPDACGLYARHCAKPIDQRELELPSTGFVVSGEARIDFRKHAAIDVKAGMSSRRRYRAHQEQSTRRQQQQRERDLTHDQRLADSDPARLSAFLADM